MATVRVSGGGTLLGCAVATYVRALLPGTEVDLSSDDAVGGIRIDLDDADRWIFLGASRGPTDAAAEALSDGACAVATLDSDPADFALALKALVEGGPGFVPIHMARWMAGEALGRNNPGGDASQPRPALTAREREILQRVARGCSNGEIAAELMITTNTVRTHLHALSVKLESTSRTRMLARARALAIPEAFDFAARAAVRDQQQRASA